MIVNNKPLGAICIAPVMIAKVLQNMGRSGKLTGGFDEKISSDIDFRLWASRLCIVSHP